MTQHALPHINYKKLKKIINKENVNAANTFTTHLLPIHMVAAIAIGKFKA